MTKIAVVTGANKGIGYGIVKGLCEKYKGLVYLTARDAQRGEEAVNKLKKLGLNPIFYELDITKQESINKLKDYIEKNHGGIDLLVNNAAIMIDSAVPLEAQAKETLEVNYYSLLRVCETLFPILKPDAQVINISSSAGHLSRIPSENIRKKFANPTLNIEGLNNLMNDFIRAADENKHIEEGWGKSSYAVSKVGVCALTFIHQKLFDSENPKRNISINCIHPGYVDTDMTDHKGHLTIEEGARPALYLAIEPHELKGKFLWYDLKVVDWLSETAPPSGRTK